MTEYALDERGVQREVHRCNSVLAWVVRDDAGTFRGYECPSCGKQVTSNPGVGVYAPNLHLGMRSHQEKEERGAQRVWA
jgi:hypothetical protein